MPIAIVTPSYGPDLSLCTTLHRSILEHSDAEHHILVPGRDLGAFRSLAGERTRLLRVEDVMPAGIRQVGTRRWISTWTARPLSGWLVQQIAKLAAVRQAEADVVVLIDSDTFVVRRLEEAEFADAGRTRLYRDPAGITSTMGPHLTWHRNACAMLGLEALQPPLPDYISSFVTWDPRLVRAALERIEQVAGVEWHRAIARGRRVSEYLIYGTFVDRVLPEAPVWHDADDRCLTWWDLRPMALAEVGDFAGRLGERDLAVLVSSHSRTPADVLDHLRRQVDGPGHRPAPGP